MDIISVASRSIGFMKRNGIRAGINEISESFSIRKLRGSDYVLPSEHDTFHVFHRLPGDECA